MFVNNLKEVKKYFREYRFIRNTLNNYLLYEKNHGLNEQDRSVLEKISDEFLQRSKEVNLFIESITDIYIKQLFCMRYLSGYTWTKIAILMGGVATEHASMMISLFLIAGRHLPLNVTGCVEANMSRVIWEICSCR